MQRRLVAPLLLLTATTGLIDAASYLAFGRVFTANMTGNVVLLGFAVANAGGLPVLAPVVSLVAFLGGAAVGGRFAKAFAASSRRRWFASALAAEAVLLVVAAVVALAVPSSARYPAIAVTAVAMGVRNSSVRRLGVPDLTTTVLTLTLTGFAADSGHAGWRRPNELWRLGAVVAMFAGAAVGAAMLDGHSAGWPLLLSAALALAAMVAAYRAFAVRA